MWATFVSARYAVVALGSGDSLGRLQAGALERDGERGVGHRDARVTTHAHLREGDNALADAELVDAEAEFADGAGHVDPGHERRVRDALVGGEGAAATEHVERAHGGVHDVHGDLTGLGTGAGSSTGCTTSGPP
jgi:hypothetical protein